MTIFKSIFGLVGNGTLPRIQVAGIDKLFDELNAQGVVHPNAPLQNKPWGSREFGVLDEDGNLITFAERGNA